MSEAAPRRLVIDEFDRWQQRQDVRCELIDGRPVAMNGASFAHDIVVSNLIRALGNGLQAAGSQCRVFTADIGLLTGPNTLRRPDLSVHCPPFDTPANWSDHPVLVAEVHSPARRQNDQVTKLDEYRALSSVQAILFIEPDRIDAALWQRASKGGWISHAVTDDPGASLQIIGLGLTLPVAEIYDGVTIAKPTGPRLVWPDEPEY